jgi:hypothetical protein
MRRTEQRRRSACERPNRPSADGRRRPTPSGNLLTPNTWSESKPVRRRQRGHSGPQTGFCRWQGFPSRPTPKTAASGLRRAEPRSASRQASIERRRRQAMSVVVPVRIAASFTMAELAVLTVIARQCQRGGTCSLHIDAVAALSGCCRRTVQTAMRAAERLGLLHIRERRVPGRKSLTNVVKVISPEWLDWLRIGGCKKMRSTDTGSFPLPETTRARNQRGHPMRRGGDFYPQPRCERALR